MLNSSRTLSAKMSESTSLLIIFKLSMLKTFNDLPSCSHNPIRDVLKNKLKLSYKKLYKVKASSVRKENVVNLLQ